MEAEWLYWFGQVGFWLGLTISIYIGFLYFRDLGDVTQMVFKADRAKILRFVRHEYKFVTVGLVVAVGMVLAHFLLGAGPAWVFWVAIGLISLLYGFPFAWVHLGFRNQQHSAKYYPIAEAKAFLNPISPVAVIEKDGVARAYPHTQIMRPHLAGGADDPDGPIVMMSYCGMANLSLGYIPEADGQKLDLEVLAQYGNNLILRDNNTGCPIQHIYGNLGGSNEGAAMTPWPTFRMTFRGFEKAFPDGQVFLNKPKRNPLLLGWDKVMDLVLTAGIAKQHIIEAPLIDNMDHYDYRLPTKTYVWGVSIGEDATCFTEDFVIEQGNLINTLVGGRAIVVSRDPVYESLGVYYNDTGSPIDKIDFFGNTEAGKLPRLEHLRPGLFWHVWANYFPHTDINRSDVEIK